MKFNNKILLVLLLTSIITFNARAENKDNESLLNEEEIDNARLKKAEVATSTYNTLPKNEVINTIYEDPLSESFMGKGSRALDKERNRSTADLLSEFEGQAKVINDNTEIPDEADIIDNHSKEDRARIEAKADELLKEAAIRESKDNSGAFLNKDDGEEFNKLHEKINDLSKKDKTKKKNEIISSGTEELENPDDKSNLNPLPDEIIEPNDINNAKIVETEVASQSNELNKDWPLTQDDPEFSKNVTSTENTNINNTNVNSPTDEIPNYEEMQGVTTLESDYSSINNEKEEKIEKKKKTKSRKEKRKLALKKKFSANEPILLTEGNPKSSDDESLKDYSFNGLLIPEKQPLGRKKSMIRWVLLLDDGSRIPLKSNLKLLREVRKESNLEDYVTISGKFRTSPLEKNLKYLVPEKITKAKLKNSEETNDIASNTTNLNEVASDTASLDDLASDTMNVNKIASDSTDLNDIASDTFNLNKITSDSSDFSDTSSSIERLTKN